MEQNALNIILQFIKRNLTINTEVAYPDLLEEGFGKRFEGYEIFETLIPGIISNISKIIFTETFDQVSGSSLMQAVKIKQIMSKKYEHLQEIVGLKRFERYIDFPSKVKKWRNLELSDSEVHNRLVESVTTLFLTAAKRDTNVFNLELLPVVRERFKEYILKEYNLNLDAISLDKIVRDILRSLDLGRAKVETKDLMKDMQTYSLILYFIQQYDKINLVLDENEIVPILNVIRKEIDQISEELQHFDDVSSRIKLNIDLIK